MLAHCEGGEGREGNAYTHTHILVFTGLQMYPRTYLRGVSQTAKPFDIDELRHFRRPLELLKRGPRKTSSYTTLPCWRIKGTTVVFAFVRYV